MSEFDLIELIRKNCFVARADVPLGIGDDAAVLAVPVGCELIVSTDTLIAGVHFPHNTCVENVGWKALAVNLSDLAAMGATPACVTLALTLPQADPDWVQKFCTGFSALANQYQVALVGGDTTQGPLSITLTVHGFVPVGQAIRRSGAQVGDAIWVTGTLGDAAGGLQLLRSTDVERIELGTTLIDRLNRPTPRIAAGLALRGIASAAIDVSDGLLADLGHICTQSFVGAKLQVDALPTSLALKTMFNTHDRLRLQLAGGDDYELCYTVPADYGDKLAQSLADFGCSATQIGHIVTGNRVIVCDATDQELTLSQRGWEHFSSAIHD